MRKTEADSWIELNSRGALRRGLRASAVALGIGLLCLPGLACAEDDEDDEPTFEQKIIGDIMRGLGATNMDNSGIDYRERSPLVVPPKLDLPPPSSSAEVKVPNWPKDPDEARRQALIAERKKQKKQSKNAFEAARDAHRPLLPSELDVARPKPGSDTPTADSKQPGGGTGSVLLSPSQLGFEGGFFGMFKGNSGESAEFKGEPSRESLTQPPPGYQTPSPNFKYGTGPKESLNKPYDPPRGKYGD